MKNFVQPGDVITITAPAGGISSAGRVQVAHLFGVAAFSADEGDDVEIKTTGVFDLAKAPGGEFAVGDPVFWDATAKVVTDINTDTPDVDHIGVAIAVAAGSAATARVRLNGAIN